MREAEECDEGGIEALLLGRIDKRIAGQSLVLLQPAAHVENFLGVGGSGVNLGDQRIGIEGDGREQLIELLGIRDRYLRIGSRRLRKDDSLRTLKQEKRD